MANLRKTLRAARAELRAGRWHEAERLYQQALAANPNHPGAMHGVAKAALAAGDPERALDWLQKLVAAEPGSPEVLHSLGLALLRTDRYAEAVRTLEAAAPRRPRDKRLQADLARARKAGVAAQTKAPSPAAEVTEHHRRLDGMISRGRLEQARTHAQELLERWPDDPKLHEAFGNACMLDGRLDEAADAYRESLRREPASPTAHFRLGEALAALGERDAAEQAQREALRLRPDFGAAWLRLAHLSGLGEAGSEDLQRLEELIDEPQLAAEDAEAMHFALAKAYDDLQQPEAAFRHLRRANGMHRERQPFELAPLLALMDRLEQVCDDELLARCRGFGSTSERPVFIVGLPRSGSTLVEQIVASHPEGFGVGELPTLARLTADLPGRLGSRTPFPECLREIDPATARAVAADYEGRLGRDAPASAQRICDKMLSNLMLIGWIAILFPAARVIHCRRHLLDVGLSMYFHSFSGSGVGYAYDLDDIGRYARRAEQLLARWRSLGPVSITEVQYESLVTTPEPAIRELLDALGLGFSPRCLESHQAKLPHRTASNWQVRQPIHTRSVERWRPYAAELEPLRPYLDR
ncbi:MAG: sulfotransferase [Deltaproteobacteria bacterium]|jgi:tetratricopeptide (TPR) repeat protein|nr:sulfotransferase [Deltaproteobacteria bacterium]MBW2534071.1 sulfotransferase [Deltaproteobacteria bacterium]